MWHSTRLAYKEEYELMFEQTSVNFDVGMRILFRWANKIALYYLK